MLYGLFFTAALFIIVSISIIYSPKPKTKQHFTLANRTFSSFGVSSVIIGTLVGGASTVGTVQMAYIYGLPACLFTLGSGIACLFLGLFFAKPLRQSNVTTVSEYIGKYFGQNMRHYTSILSSLGIFIHIIAQFLASAAIISSSINIGFKASLFITFILLIILVITGGIINSQILGKIKILLIYSIMFISLWIVLEKSNFFFDVLGSLPNKYDWFSFKRYGYKNSVVDLTAMIIGVISTQTYLQAIFSAKTVKDAKRGAFLSAFLIPPIGFIGIAIGLYLRVYHPELSNLSAKALPYFIKLYFPEPVSAILNAFLLIIVLGTAAGLTLGVSTNIFNDIVKKANSLFKVRITTALVALLSLIIVLSNAGSQILDWSFLSMGFRGFSVFVPLIIILFFSNKWKDIYDIYYVKFLIYVLPMFYLLLKLYNL